MRLQIYANLFRVSNKLQVIMDKNLKDITSKQWFVLGVLEYFDESPTLTGLAKELGYSHQNTKQLLNKLDEKGYVTIKTDVEDKRSIRIFPTNKVEEWGVSNHESAKEFVQYLFSDINSEEIDVMSRVLKNLYEKLERFDEIVKL